MADSFYGFKGVDHLAQALVGDQLELNVYSWLRWGLLGVGAFTGVTDPSGAAPHGGAPAKLRPVVDPRYAPPAGTTYFFEGARPDWVWETGVPYAVQPAPVSGVWVDGAFVPAAATGVYAHRVNYPEGRVYFPTPVPTGADVRATHAYRTVHVRRADEPWFREAAFRSLRADEAFAAPAGSGGSWEVLAQNRVPLPALVVEVVNRVGLTPLEVGGSARIHRQDCVVHVLAETPWDARRLHDLLVEQYDKRVPTFDANAVTFPLDAAGAPASGALTFPGLAAAHPWRTVRVARVDSVPQDDLGGKLYWTAVRYGLEIEAP